MCVRFDLNLLDNFYPFTLSSSGEHAKFFVYVQHNWTYLSHQICYWSTGTICLLRASSVTRIRSDQSFILIFGPSKRPPKRTLQVGDVSTTHSAMWLVIDHPLVCIKPSKIRSVRSVVWLYFTPTSDLLLYWNATQNEQYRPVVPTYASSNFMNPIRFCHVPV